MKNKWTVELQEDPETKELIMPIPIDLLTQMGWNEETDFWWEIKNDTVIMKVKDETESSKS